VKIVALVPRVTNLFVRNKRNVDAQVDKMLAKKLERVFAVLDEDLDNKIEYESLQLCLSRMKKGKGMQDRVSQTTMLAAPSSTFMNIGASGGVSVRSLKTHMSLRTPTSRGHHRVVTSAATSSTLGEKAATPMSGSPTDSREASSQLVWQKAETDSRGQDSITRAAPPVRSSVTSNLVSEDSVTLDVFKGKIMEDEWVYQKLRAACEAELRNSHSVGNMASKHAEDVGMKVALAVLVMLLAVNLLSPTQVDLSALQGLRYLDHQVVRKMADGSMNATGPIPSEVQEHVQVWLQSSSEEQGLMVRYLDMNQQVFCSDFASHGGGVQPCSGLAPSAGRSWSERGSLAQIDVDWGAWSAEHTVEGRRDYLEVLTQPDASGDVSEHLSDEEYNARMRTVAVVSVKPDVQAKALQLIWTTLVVISIIVLGIIFITMDLALMHRTLTDPLRALSFEMQSIKRMQLAGLDEHMEGNHSRDLRTEEIRVIQKIFENMKTAIKSWGKYVPWPVVQLLLQAGVDAEPNVAEKEVTLFFSDIAGFTGIVETMPPERSMVLLTKYFNDMSKVIDEHSGIVIEFIGDAIYAMYGAPLPDKGDHPTNAVKAAVGMLAQLDRINKWSVKQSPPLPEVGIRCGIHTGTCLVGNMGFASRIKYGVVGENANIPGRLEEMNKNYGTNNLMSAETYKRLDHTQFAIRPIDYVHLRQRDPPESEPVYEVLGVGVHRKLRMPVLQAVAKRHAEAMELYIEQRFSEALPLFDEVNSKMQELTGCEADQPSVMLQARCKAYMLQPPGPEWDGVWNPDIERLAGGMSM